MPMQTLNEFALQASPSFRFLLFRSLKTLELLAIVINTYHVQCGGMYIVSL